MIITANRIASSPAYKTDKFVVPAIPSNTFTLTFTPLADSMIVLLNGMGLTEGASNDFTLSGKDVTIVSAHELRVGDIVTAIYPH